uniref:ATP synthase F0 subunit 8 n=1 Tax=Cuspidaria undata TaxID=2952366 RepID=A0AAT9T701_9BIVA|nr:ATP synthase F0 subunit 8 [Cuspidaria undata]USF19207.1 ATP synthase F0 subunit 8 [Cuspidaria undata]
MFFLIVVMWWNYGVSFKMGGRSFWSGNDYSVSKYFVGGLMVNKNILKMILFLF